MNQFSESERRCQAIFESCGDVYHAYTSGKDMPIVFTSNEDLVFAMNSIAFAAFLFKESIRIAAFAVMDNHLHFIIIGSQPDIEEFFRHLVRKLKRTIQTAGGMSLSLKVIKDLTSMRNNIVYTNRNGYVANPHHTPFSYPWSTGRYYFNDITATTTYADIDFYQKRAMLRGRAAKFPEDWQVIGGYISPASYCAVIFGMSLFRDAHHYFSLISKNIEAYSSIAVDIGDGEFLTDRELFSEILRILKTKYAGAKLNSLSSAQKLDLARNLRYDFHSSNGQIRRVLGLRQYDIDQLFPNNI